MAPIKVCACTRSRPHLSLRRFQQTRPGEGLKKLLFGSIIGALLTACVLYTIRPWTLFLFARHSSLNERSLRSCNYVHPLTMPVIVMPSLLILTLSNCRSSRSLRVGCLCRNRTAQLLDLQRWSLERMEKANWTDCLSIQ